MTVERFTEIFEEDDYIYTIKEDLIFKGLSIIHKYFPIKSCICSAEHDIIYSVSIEDLVETNITEEEVIELRKCGFDIDTEFDCLYHFV